MKKSGQIPVTTWEIVRKCSSYNPISKRCYLCLNEKLEVASYQGNNLLNKKTELISKCRLQNKYSLSKYDTKKQRQLYCKTPIYCNFLFVNYIWLKIVGQAPVDVSMYKFNKGTFKVSLYFDLLQIYGLTMKAKV